jgi:hypothetical protein
VSPSVPEAPAPEPIRLTVTYDPYEDMERELARQQAERDAAAEVSHQAQEGTNESSVRNVATQDVDVTLTAAIPAQAREPREVTDWKTPAPAIPLEGLPQDFSAEVSCKDAQLRALYQLLPYDVEPLAVLDEDWRIARSTGQLSGTRTRVSFPLRYLRENGTPLMLTLRRSARTTGGKQWSLQLVDGDDGTGHALEAVGFEGLPTSDDGAWSCLVDGRAQQLSNPTRELAQEVVIGTWDLLLGTVAHAAAPEHWDYPGEGVGQQSRYGILRDYLAMTWHRIRCQQRLQKSSDGRLACFSTGLLSPLNDELYAVLERRDGDIPWKFIGIAAPGQGELGSRLSGSFSHLPEGASYLSSLESVVVDHTRMVVLDTESILAKQIGRLPRAFLAEVCGESRPTGQLLDGSAKLGSDELKLLSRTIRDDQAMHHRFRSRLDDALRQSLQEARASYRLAAPVYDALENRTKLVLPLSLVQEGHADCAVVLDLQSSGAYRAGVLAPLERAYACARVISREQPSWLAVAHRH